jgi:hypothetical protein
LRAFGSIPDAGYFRSPAPRATVLFLFFPNLECKYTQPFKAFTRKPNVMSKNNLVALVAAVREALATPQSLIASTSEEQEARLDMTDLIPELNAALVGDTEHLRELAWSVG